MIRLLQRTALAMLFLGVSLLAAAQDKYPSRAVYIIVPFPAGGPADLLPRMVGREALAEMGRVGRGREQARRRGQHRDGVRRPGAGGRLHARPRADRQPHGEPDAFKHLPFDTARDFQPVTLLANVPNVLVVNPSVPAKTFQEFIAYAKANPGKLNFASPGPGSGAHLAGELLDLDAGIKMVHVPYKGIAPAVNDLLGGQVQLMFSGVSAILQQVRTGKLRALAIAGPHRLASLPGVPTIAESGYPGFDVTSWYGIVAKTGTPPAVIRKVHDGMVWALRQPDVVKKMEGLGLEPVGDTPQQFQKVIDSESKKWGDIVRRANIHLE